MSGNGEPIDLNSDVDLGGQEFEAHGISPSHPVTDSLNEQSKAESRSRELEEDEAIDVQEINSSREGLCRSDKDRADTNVGYEAADDNFLEGKSPYNAKGAEMEAGAKMGEESSMEINALLEAALECSDSTHISGKVVVCGDEIIADDNEVALEWATAAGTLNASSSDALVCCEGKRQAGRSLASLNEFTEGGLADAMTGRHSIISIAIERNVESQEEGVRTMQNEEEKVQQDEELAFGSVDVKRAHIVKEDCRSHTLLDHEGSVDVLININPEGPFHHQDVDDSASLHENFGSDSPRTADDRRQLTDNLSQKAEKLTESDELSPVLATDIRATPTLDCPENQSRKAGGGQTIENPVTGCHFPKTEALTDIDEANLFDVVVEMDPHVIMDEDVSDDVGADSADSVVEFNVSDLVWGKVPSHPWWPGQICDPSASSKKAMKYFKTGRYLIAFFGDHSFAWKEALMIKPFREFFSELQKQSNLESFHQAINCALEEFSRRVEFSLACSCLSKELYSKLQTQTLANAGIRKKSSTRLGGDSSLTASSFDPMKLINIVKEVATLPCGEADKLELVRARAQLLAFNRWKGYNELPKFDKHSVEFNNTDHVLVVENEYHSESIKDIAIDFKHDEVALHGKGSLRTQDSSRGKRKHKSEDFIYASKKGKNLSDLMSKKPRRLYDAHGSEENAGNELNLYASSTKYEVIDAICNDPTVNNPISHVSRESAYESGKTKQTFRVGDRIQRVAFKLNESNPIFKHDDGISQKAVTKTKGNRKPSKIPNQQLLHTEYPLNEVLSQLCLAAINPMKGFGFLGTIVTIFSQFRKFVSLDLANLEAQETLELVSGGKAGNKLTKTEKRKKVSAPMESSDSEFIKDSYWTDRLIQGIAEDQSSFENQNKTVECHIQTPTENDIPTAVEQDGLLCPGVNSTNQEPRERVELESENCVEDVYPTALILTFTDLDSAPSETNLNNIFRKYGALYESKTEVMKKSRRAKVVFKRNSDAEAAFSSVGKYSIFGPALVSYRLKYVPPTKVSSCPTKRRRKEAKS